MFEKTVPTQLVQPKRSVRICAADPRPKNRLLASLPHEDFQRLRTHLRTIPTAVKQVFHAANTPIREVIFLNGGVASVTSVMKNGAMVEIATVGDEGLVGLGALFGGSMAVGETMMQVPDTSAEALPVAIFRQECDRRGPFFDDIQRYLQGVVLLMMQSTGCMALRAVHDGFLNGFSARLWRAWRRTQRYPERRW